VLDTPARDLTWSTAAEIAAAFSAGRVSALNIIEATLTRIRSCDPLLNSFTTITEQRARSRAQALDDARSRGEPPPPLAAVPFGAKNLFDIAGLVTIAGSKINRDAKPAARDATLIERLESSGAILVGALNMGEYAYDFTGENVHDGPSRNPHDLNRMSGGSSGGSAAAVAGGLVPLSLASDTNGSIRVPASLCGLFGLKPTYGRLSCAGTFPFVTSLDHVGPLARTTRDLALAYDAMQGYDARDPVCVEHAPEPVSHLLDRGLDGLRVAVAGGYFKGQAAEPVHAIDLLAAALGANRDIELPEAGRARSAAFVVTASEAATLHLDRLRARAQDFDPAVRDRLIAGAMAPGSLVTKAQKFRRWYRDEVLKLFAEIDAILVPATPCTAPLIGQQTFTLGDVEMPIRPNLGLYTQPISFIGLPVVAVPVPLSPLPIAVQVVTAPWREDVALRIAHALETQGIAAAPRPAEF
jgi:1-carboxybiuret hydrolase